MRFHISPKAGLAKPCRAFLRLCPLGASEHFSTLQEAQVAAEEKLAREFSEAPAVAKATPLQKAEVLIEASGKRITEDSSKSAFYCPQCSTHLSYEEEGELLGSGGYAWCAVCQHYLKDAGFGKETVDRNGEPMRAIGLAVKRDSLWLFDESTYGDNSLYHVTTRSNWHEDITAKPDLFLHLGSKEATYYRGLDLENDSSGSIEAFYLYELKLKPGLGVERERILDDHDTAWDEEHHAGSKILKERHEIYHNRHEAPGSLSLAATQEHFEIAGVRKLTPNELFKEWQS